MFGASARAASALEPRANAPALRVSIFINRSAKMTKYVGSHFLLESRDTPVANSVSDTGLVTMMD